VKWAEEKAEMENRLAEALEVAFLLVVFSFDSIHLTLFQNERASASAVLSLNQQVLHGPVGILFLILSNVSPQVVKLEAVLSQHRKEREEISLSKKSTNIPFAPQWPWNLTKCISR